jgi:hypothetical protein
MRTFRILLALGLLGAAGIAGYGYLGDMAPPVREITIDLPPPPPGGG